MSSWYRSPLPWLMILCCALLVWAFVRIPSKSTPAEVPIEQPGITKVPNQVEVFAGDPAVGPKSAKVTIVEFSDFECPYCAQSAPVIEQTAKQVDSRLRLVWKDYPVHEEALSAAIAGQCAHQQGKFWQYHDALFREQSRLGHDMYLQLAGEVGLQLEQFTKCFERRETQPIVERNVREGDSIGVDGTPFFVVNGQAWSGLLTSSDLERIMQQYP